MVVTEGKPCWHTLPDDRDLGEQVKLARSQDMVVFRAIGLKAGYGEQGAAQGESVTKRGKGSTEIHFDRKAPEVYPLQGSRQADQAGEGRATHDRSGFSCDAAMSSAF
jgi:hypothetical protein